MKILMIGGTGLLGSEGAREYIKRGHEVTSIALPPLPEGATLPEEMKIHYGNYLEMSDDELRGYLKGVDAFVFAAGVDERVEGPAPIYNLYGKYNIEPLHRFFKLCKEEGVKKAVVLGSYFSHFAKKWPHLKLTMHHPYIRSRIDQEKVALSYADDNFQVVILELPYIFGTQPGRKPVWTFLVDSIRNMDKVTLYPAGGTTMVTVKQVAQVMAGALETEKSGAYPIGFYNLTWREFLKVVHESMGMPDRKIITIPKFVYKMGGKQIAKRQKEEGIDPGLNMVKFADLQCNKLFIEPSEGALSLGMEPDDIESAIKDSIRLSMDVLDGHVDAIEMKGEQ